MYNFRRKVVWMTNLEYITDELKNEMKMHVTDTQQFDTWIRILKPLNLYNETLYLEERRIPSLSTIKSGFPNFRLLLII